MQSTNSLPKVIFRNLRWKLAQTWLSFFPETEIIGVAGSVGKTTTKEIIASILGEKFRTIKTTGNFDPIFNLPLTAFKIRKNTKLVAELSVDKTGQMDKYLTLIKPRIGVVTKLSIEHADNEHFGSPQDAIREEQKLIKSLPDFGWSVTSGDDKLTVESATLSKAKVVLCGFNEGNDLQIINFLQKIISNQAKSYFEIKCDNKNYQVETNLLGKHNALVVCYGIAVGIISGMDFAEIQRGISKIFPVEHRLQPKKSRWGVVIDDTYNAIPAAVEGAIDVLVNIDKKNPTLVLGEMKELGEYSKDQHFLIGKYAKGKGIKRLAVIGDHAKEVVRGFRGSKTNCLLAKSNDEIIQWLNETKPSIVLIKGSRSMQMEKVVEAICA